MILFQSFDGGCRLLKDIFPTFLTTVLFELKYLCVSMKYFEDTEGRCAVGSVVVDAVLAQPHSSSSPIHPRSLPCSCHPGCGWTRPLWQLLITGWPGPAALCMTASRPTQVTQREGELGRVGEKGGWAGQRERNRERESEEEKIEQDRKDWRGEREGN